MDLLPSICTMFKQIIPMMGALIKVSYYVAMVGDAALLQQTKYNDLQERESKETIVCFDRERGVLNTCLS